MNNYNLFKQCLECRECFQYLPADKKYLPTPWQGQLGDNTKILFIGINPSPRDYNEINKTEDKPDQVHLAQQGYSIKADDYDKYFDKEKVCKTIYEGLANADNRKRIHNSLKVKGFSFSGTVMKVSRVLLGRDDIDDFKEFAVTELIHCQTDRENKIKYRHLKSMFIKCFELHTQNYLRALNNLNWIVFLGGNAKIFFTLPETLKILNDIFDCNIKPPDKNVEDFDIIRLTGKINILFLPFFGWRTWKSKIHLEELRTKLTDFNASRIY